MKKNDDQKNLEKTWYEFRKHTHFFAIQIIPYFLQSESF